MGFWRVFIILFVCQTLLHTTEAAIPRRLQIGAAVCLAGLVTLAGYEVGVRQMNKMRLNDLRETSSETWNGFQRLNSGSLTPFWAQEYIGVDLVRAELKTQSFPKVGVGMLDGGIDFSKIPESRIGPDLGRAINPLNAVMGHDASHGVVVANLILGDQVGSSENAELRAINSDALRYPNVKVINISMLLYALEKTNDLQFKASVRKFGSSQRILVFASGKKAGLGALKPLKEKLFPEHSNLGQGFEGIFVSSIDVDGKMSFFSPTGDDVTILVPSDVALQTRFGSELTSFGFGSGAAPLVTGAVADLISVLGDLKLDELKILLSRTAIRVPANEDSPGKTGYGMLNAYKAYRVALRMNDRGWEFLTHSQRLRLLSEDSLYDFSAERASSSSEEADLRKAFFLQPTRESAESLSQFYARNRLNSNAEFYSRVSRIYLEKQISIQARAF